MVCIKIYVALTARLYIKSLVTSPLNEYNVYEIENLLKVIVLKKLKVIVPVLILVIISVVLLVYFSQKPLTVASNGKTKYTIIHKDTLTDLNYAYFLKDEISKITGAKPDYKNGRFSRRYQRI